MGTALALSAVSKKSVTIDEFQALPTGLAILKTGDLRFPKGTPPLSQVLPAIPLLFKNVKLDLSRIEEDSTSWTLGHLLASENQENYPSLFIPARILSTLILMLSLFLACAISRNLYGLHAGSVTAIFAAFSPTLLAHGALVTPDIYLTASLLSFLLFLDKLRLRPSYGVGAALGISMAAAVLSKFTGLLLFVFFPLLALWRPDSDKKMIRLYRRSLFLAGVTGIALIHLAYLGKGFLPELASFSFKSDFFRLIQKTISGQLPLPFPRQFILSLDDQIAEKGYASYLLGEHNKEGFYLYYLIAILVKSPVALILLPVVAWFAKPKLHSREIPYVALTAFLFIFFSAAKHKNVGVRYLLFSYPLLAIWIGRILKPDVPERVPSKFVSLMLAIGAFSAVFGTLLSWPHYIAYFNLLSGGPKNGYKYLLDSNLDWGQDLIELREYLDAKNLPDIELAYAGRVRPELYGIHYSTLKGLPTKQHVAVSVNLLWGRPYFVNGTPFWPKDPDTYRYLRNQKPEAILGHTIYVFDLSK